MVELRPYQKQKIQEIYDAWQNHRSVMLQMPTGTGKTVLFNQIVKDELAKNSRLLIVAHRKELIDQNVTRLLSDFGIRAGTIMGKVPSDLSLPVQVASIQTLSERDYLDLNPSKVIIDEAHHATTKSYRKLWDDYPDSKFLGVTATPIRLSGEGFNDLFDTLIVSNSISEFIKDGHLAEIKYLGRQEIWSKLDLSSVSINNTGDYDSTQLSLKMRQDFVMANLIKSYLTHAEGKKMIVFAVDVKHSEYIVKGYEDKGFTAAHVGSKTDKHKRTEIINKFREGKIQILSNVNIISEGFDVHDCEVVQLARPTKSLTMYLQQIGRCMRTSASKTHCIVLDNVGLYTEFGSPKSHRNWTLEATKNNSTIVSPNSSSENFETVTRNNPQEIDEDLIILEDVDMPNESKTVSKSFPEIDEELKLRIEISNSYSEEKQSKEQELQDLIFNQEERLQKILPTFQDLVHDFFNNNTQWRNEDDKKIFALRLKISYDFSKNRVKVDLDDRQKKATQYLEVTDVDDELVLRTEFLQLTQSIKQKKRNIKTLEESSSIDDFAIKINELSSDISELELNKKNKFKELRNIIFDQEERLQQLVINFRALVYDFFNNNTQWESEDDKKNFVWRLRIYYDFLDNTIKSDLDKRFKKIISYLEVIINEISCFTSDKEIDDNADYCSYYGDNPYNLQRVFRVIKRLAFLEYISEDKTVEILSSDNTFNEFIEIYSKYCGMIYGMYIDWSYSYYSKLDKSYFD